MTIRNAIAASLVLTTFLFNSGLAQEKSSEVSTTAPIPEPKSFITEHQVQNGNRKISLASFR